MTVLIFYNLIVTKKKVILASITTRLIDRLISCNRVVNNDYQISNIVTILLSILTTTLKFGTILCLLV